MGRTGVTVTVVGACSVAAERSANVKNAQKRTTERRENIVISESVANDVGPGENGPFYVKQDAN